VTTLITNLSLSTTLTTTRAITNEFCNLRLP